MGRKCGTQSRIFHYERSVTTMSYKRWSDLNEGVVPPHNFDRNFYSGKAFLKKYRAPAVKVRTSALRALCDLTLSLQFVYPGNAIITVTPLASPLLLWHITEADLFQLLLNFIRRYS